MKELCIFLEVSVCAKMCRAELQSWKYKKKMSNKTGRTRGSHRAVQIYMFKYICIDKVYSMNEYGAKSNSDKDETAGNLLTKRTNRCILNFELYPL